MLREEVGISERRGMWNGIQAIPRPTSSTMASNASTVRPTGFSEASFANDISAPSTDGRFELRDTSVVYELEASNVY